MWYEATAIRDFQLGRRNKGIKVGDTIYWTHSAVKGNMILFNGQKAWESLSVEFAGGCLGDLSNPVPAKNWMKVWDDYMTVSVR